MKGPLNKEQVDELNDYDRFTYYKTHGWVFESTLDTCWVIRLKGFLEIGFINDAVNDEHPNIRKVAQDHFALNSI